MPDREQARRQERETVLNDMAAGPLDLLVIGGGIVGAGVARDAAMRGLRIGLVDRRDFASGTSSRSSRLLHGGLRYLAQGRIRLVHEASVEKKILHRIAPHLADPLPFIFPTYRGGAWKLWKLRIGVKIYDLLCGGRNLGPSSGADADTVHRWLPGLETEGLTGAVRYFDGLTNDARLVLDSLRSAEAHGAKLANYTEVTATRRADDGWACDVRDELTDNTHTLRAKCVVNAAGTWGDRFESSAVALRPTKGVHLVVSQERLPVHEAVVLTEGKRILFTIPWGQRTILGTTDTDYADDPDDVGTDEDDVRYVLAVTNKAFPAAKLTADDVVSHWAGLRPLIADPKGKPSDISRDHQIQCPTPGWVDVAGGKLTTYRLIAEQTVDAVARELGRKLPDCRTAQEPLLPPNQAGELSRILPPEVGRAAVEHFCRHEWARHLDDVMVRRTSWAYYLEDDLPVAERVADWMAEELGWDRAAADAELAAYRNVPVRTRPAATADPVAA